MTTTEPRFATDADGVALGGHDAVAYHLDGEARPGSTAHEVSWAGARWRFSSAGNAERFEADPERWAPAFGGRCAFGASLGKDAEASPEAWRIIDDRLHLLRDPAVRALSRLFTGRIRRARAAAG